MRPTIRLLAVLLGLVMLAGTGAATAADDDLVRIRDHDTLQALFSDKTLYGHFIDGPDWVEYHRPDGTTSYLDNGCVLKGQWEIEDGYICYRYVADPNEFHCFNVYQRGENILLNGRSGIGDQPVSEVDRMEKGNVENLPPGGGGCLDT
jgi:hypothetical protein